MEKIENYSDECDELYIIPMGQFPYLCEKCGGGDERCCNESCDVDGCPGGQFCWSNSAMCVMYHINLSDKSLSDVQKDISERVFNRWKGKPVEMIYNGYGLFTCARFPSIMFNVECNADAYESGISVKAWCAECWSY